MYRTSDILNRFSKQFGFKEASPLRVIQKKWSSLVGEVIAAHTYPHFLKKQTLFIKVDSPQWFHHLSYLKTEMINKLEEFQVKSIRFTVGDIPQEEDLFPRQTQKKLTVKELTFIRKTTLSLRDEQLRKCFESLMIKAMSTVKVNKKKPLKNG